MLLPGFENSIQVKINLNKNVQDGHQIVDLGFLPALGQSQGYVKSFLGSSTGWWTDTTGLPNKACPRLRDLVTAPAHGITQPRKNLIREPCTATLLPVKKEIARGTTKQECNGTIDQRESIGQ